MAAIQQVLGQLRAMWDKLGPRTRALLMFVAVVGAVVAAGMAIGGAANQRVLFAGLAPKDAAAVVAALDTAKIEYTLSGDGTVIKVPGSEVDRARLLLAEQDLPGAGNVGFELFEDQSFGLTDFAQRVNYRRALQGELERTIVALDSVAGARVHITQPARAVFEDEKIAPTASVTLDLAHGRTVGEQKVGAIRHLVAAAVEGLEADAVTVVDTKGNLLSRPGADAEAVAALDYRHDLERDLEQRITRLLERTVGVGGAQVNVSADIDFSHTDTTEESYDPEQTAVRAETTQESYEGAGAKPGGLAGAGSNSPGAAAGTVARGDASSQVVRSKNYEVNRTVVRTVGPRAAVRRLTVAVLVDGTYTPAEDGADPVFAPRADTELGQLQSVVENAMGFNAARGDRIKIASVQFNDRPPLGTDDMTLASATPPWMPYAIGGGALAAVALMFLMLRKRKGQKPLEPEVLQFPTTVSEAQRMVAGGTPAAAVAGAPMAALPEGQTPALPEKPEDLRARVLGMASGDPERTAEIIRSWMQEADA